MNKTILFGLLVLLAVLVMPTATAANVTLQFNPQGSSVPGYCNNTTVEIQLDIPAGLTVSYGQLGFDYTPACGNIIDRNLNTDIMTGVDPAWSTWNSSFLQNDCWDYDTDWIVYKFWIPKTGPTVVTIGNFTIHGNSTSYCVSDLNFSCKAGCSQGCTNVWDTSDIPVAFNTTNGTFTCGTPSTVVDLIVSDITVNYDRDANGIRDMAIGPRLPGTRTQCNNISMDITELDGVNVAAGFNVKLEINGVEPSCSPMWVPPGMAGGSTVTVYCDCFRPIADVQYNISATVDSGGVIVESNETNNTGWENLTAITHGYKGNGWQDGRNVSALQCHDKGPINLTYSHGDSCYVSGYSTQWNTYTVNWTLGDLSIPANSTIKKARLYAYYHGDGPGDKWANLSLEFNGDPVLYDHNYSDGKTFDPWDYSSDYGVLAYDVKAPFENGIYPHEAILTDNNPPGVGSGRDRNVSMEGMVLVVVYENSTTEPERIIWINEGCDLISSKYYSRYGVSPEEATTYAAFPGCEPIPTSLVTNATLISITQCGNQGGDLNKLDFNGLHEWLGLFPGGYVPCTNLGIHEADVKDYLTPTDNVATYQDNGDSFAAANSFLIVELQSEVLVKIDPCPAYVYPGGNVTVNITLSGITDYGSGTICLCAEPCCGDSAYALIESVGLGDSSQVTHSPLGDTCVCISASNADGLSGDVVFATVTLEPMGNPGECICLNLTVDSLYDRNYTAMQKVVDDCLCCNNTSAIGGGCLCIIEDDPPFIVSAIADPPLIYNLSCSCPTCTNLTVHATDATGVVGVCVNLTPILGAGCDMVRMTGPDGAKDGDWYLETCANYSRPLNPYCLDVMTKDLHGNWNNGSCITLEVRRTGDVNLDNNVDSADYLIIAQYTVGLKPRPDLCSGDIVPPANPDGIIDMGDALYIAMYATWNPIPGYPEPGSLCPCPCPCPPCPPCTL